jgi:hypothetical protein
MSDLGQDLVPQAMSAQEDATPSDKEQRVFMHGVAARRIAELAQQYDLPKATVASILTMNALDPDPRGVEASLRDAVERRRQAQQSKKAGVDHPETAAADMRTALDDLAAAAEGHTVMLRRLQSAVIGSDEESLADIDGEPMRDTVRAIRAFLRNSARDAEDQKQVLAAVRAMLEQMRSAQEGRGPTDRPEDPRPSVGTVETGPSDLSNQDLLDLLRQEFEALGGKISESQPNWLSSALGEISENLRSLEEQGHALMASPHPGAENASAIDAPSLVTQLAEIMDSRMDVWREELRSTMESLLEDQLNAKLGFLMTRIPEILPAPDLGDVHGKLNAISQSLGYIVEQLPGQQDAFGAPSPGFHPETIDAALAEIRQQLDRLEGEVGRLASEAGKTFYLQPTKSMGRAFLGKLQPVVGA